MSRNIYSVRTESLDHAFVAAHALIFGGVAESPHTHRFRIRTELTGNPDASGCVVDFRQVDRILRELCATLDSRFLVGTADTANLDKIENLVKTSDLDNISTFEKRVLSIPSPSAEYLAQWFAERLREGLRGEYASSLTQIRVEIEETPGMYGVCELVE